MKTLLASLFGATMLLASGEAFASRSASVSNGMLSLSCSPNEGQCEFWVEKVGYNIRIFPAGYPYRCGITKASDNYIWSFSASTVTSIYFSGGGEDDALFVAPGTVRYVHALGKGGQDTFKVRANALLEGGDNNDCLEAADGTIYGGSGDDVLGGVNRSGNAVEQLGGMIIYGDDGNDQIFGTQFDDDLDGNLGDDKIFGNSGNDTLYGGMCVAYADCDDYIEGGDGDDSLDGDIGDDLLNGGNGDDYILGGPGYDTINGGDGADHIYGQSNPDDIEGGPGDDHLYGGDGGDYLYGGTGDDHIDGQNGDDHIWGEAGSNYLYGSAGKDYCDDSLYLCED